MSMLPRRRFLKLAAAGPLLPLVGCASSSSSSSDNTATEALPTISAANGESINAFGFDLYSQLATDQANHFLSPYSISTALTMTAAGAQGTTREQMAKVLYLPVDLAASDALTQAPTAKAGEQKLYSLTVANAIFAQTGYPWAESFKTRVTKTYNAGLVDADFKANAEKERRIINAWVEKQTQDKIKELLKAGILNPLTRMVLVNAIYFKGDWAAAFHKGDTKDLHFMQMDGTKKNVPLMHKTGGDYAETDTVQMVRLPYKGNDLSFLAILPRKAGDFAKVEKILSKETLATWNKGLHAQKDLQIWLPRFKVETTYSLKSPLIAMGMSDAFSDRANFDGMVSNPPAKLFISAVEHKAFVDVNEEGSEAAAATAVVVGDMSARKEPQTFRADRPFLFAIRHEASGAILFLGRVAKV